MNIHANRKHINPSQRYVLSRTPRATAAPTARFIDGYLSYLLARASHTVYREFDTQVRAAGLASLEWRLLATLSDGDGLTIGELAREILAQQPTLTKLVQRMEKAGWVQRGVDPADARRTLVFETRQGRDTVAALLARAKAHEDALLQGFSQRDVLALKKILLTLIGRGDGADKQLISGIRAPAGVILRDPQPGDMGWVVQQHAEVYAREYGWNSEFEALVADIIARYVRNYKPDWERCWIAEQDGQRIGSAFVVRKSASVAQLRMLILTPQARGQGLGARLTDECITFARAKGYKKIVLWTNSCLNSARAIYAKRGFQLIESEPYTGFGQKLVGETWALRL